MLHILQYKEPLFTLCSLILSSSQTEITYYNGQSMHERAVAAPVGRIVGCCMTAFTHVDAIHTYYARQAIELSKLARNT